MRKLTLLLLACIGVFNIHAQNNEQRIEELLKKMTVEEKVAQLRSSFAANPKVNRAFFNDKKKIDSLFGNGISMINPDFDNSLEESINNRNKTQEYLRKTRLGIPAIFLDEAHHGLLAMKTDVFPTSIGLACSWDTLLTERIYNYVAAQAKSRGTTMVLSPVIDVTRDPRWGRTGETFGEDPYLCGLMGSAVVRGLQGGGVMATLKHFTGHGQSEGGVNQAPADFSERVLRTFHMEPFRLAIQRSSPAAIMPAYVEIDGIPAHANSWLLKDVLRKEWKYDGVLVSDWWAIDQLHNKHFVAKDKSTAALMAFNAGVTVDLPYGNNYEKLIALVKEGRINMKDLDEAVSYVLRLKFKMGLFEAKEIKLEEALAKINQPEGRELSRVAAERSMVLLKNQNNILPLPKGRYKKIAVIGPMAATNYTGDYSGVPVHNVSLLEGVKNKVGNTAEVLYAKGVDLSLNGDTYSLNNYQYTGRVKWPSRENNLRKIDSAVAVAQQSDIIICAVGENEQFSREAGNPDRFGDVSTLELLSDQNDLVKALIATGKPVIVYLAHGRPLCVNYIQEKASAIIDGWFSGQETGNAFANILFGDVNPSGKLTISVPRSVGQLPIYYNRKPSAHHFEYVSEKNTPLYPFGFGLSYNKYGYSNIQLRGNTVSVDVTNQGKLAGDEIVQLYVHQKVSSATRPVKELKNFQRISVQPGETKKVSFEIDANMLAYWNAKMQYLVEPGVFEIMIGPNSEELLKINYNYK
ncbi:beta-glucosidase [Sediminibacterium roseum]|uniref:beta-glucosidase n=1 Tax=Sediminibacterium roseum TaxID=1978412 RepID=A0ABX0A2A6_9BACT|nr:glycoside hydrolase family 3 N-terminal domain-containing protein [Sediminibacterium roseum]NCI51335.1 beta-glucosidase [Sediminibacterium roseum]